jgi:hypothetical protein
MEADNILNRVKGDCPYLREIIMENASIKDAIEIACALKNNTNIRKLKLFGNKLDDNTKEILYQIVRKKNIELSFLKNFIVVFGEDDDVFFVYKLPTAVSS